MVEKKAVQKAKADQNKKEKSEPKTEEAIKKEVQKKPEKRPVEKPKKARRGELRAEDIIRLAETNLDATKPVKAAIRRIRGVGFMFSNAVANVCSFGDKRLGDLSDHELKTLEDIIMNPEKFNIPLWMYNRKKDPVDGKNKHLIASQLELTTKMDINAMKKLKTYKGVRHAIGLPVRGQRTRGSFRKGKVVGVSRSKGKPGKGGKK